jgi:hypothetical protein
MSASGGAAPRFCERAEALRSAIGSRCDPALLLIVVVGAIPRFVGLAHQSFSLDETATLRLIQDGLGHDVSRVLSNEQTPPLYFVLIWVWARITGATEAGLRSLSAVLGTLTVPVVYAAARQLVSRRAALFACAFVATNPFLIWYSQEARAYALLSLLIAASVLCFVRTLDQPRLGRLAIWAAVATLALWTHYFAVFVIGPEAAWLAVKLLPGGGNRDSALVRELRVTFGGFVLALAALAPIAVHQYLTNASDPNEGTPPGRLIRVLPQLFVGYGVSAVQVFAGAALALILLYATWRLITQSATAERPGTWLGTGVTALALVIPFALIALGVNAVKSVHLQIALIPVSIPIGVALAGIGATRISLTAATLMCGLGLIIVADVYDDPLLQRVDYRGAAHALGRPSGRRLITATSDLDAHGLLAYLSAARQLARGEDSVREIDIVELSEPLGSQRSMPPLNGALHLPIDGFTVARIATNRTYRIVVLRSPTNRVVTVRALEHRWVRADHGAVVLQTPNRRL